MPLSERKEGLCCIYPVVLGGFFALLVPSEKSTSGLCTDFVAHKLGCWVP